MLGDRALDVSQRAGASGEPRRASPRRLPGWMIASAITSRPAASTRSGPRHVPLAAAALCRGCGMIEVIDQERCTSCDICVNVCPTNVFDKTDWHSRHRPPERLPELVSCASSIVRRMRCSSRPSRIAVQSIDVAALKQGPLMESYRRAVGWTDDSRHLRELPIAAIACSGIRAEWDQA